jgi:hypothetical protein
LRHFYGADLDLGKANVVVEAGQAKPESEALPGFAVVATIASILWGK